MQIYRVGIVGCTGISGRRTPESPLFGAVPDSHALAYAEVPQCQVVAVCDIAPERTKQFIESWGSTWRDIHAYTGHEDMLAQEELDILSVATSDNQHADIVVDASNCGVRGIFCEKPLATTVADADRMVGAIEANNVAVIVDHTRRWWPIFHEARNFIHEGRIGDLQTIVATQGGPRAMMFRNGTHVIDMICFMAQSSPVWVFAELEDGFDNYSKYAGDGGHDPATEPAASGYIHFENGVRAFYNCWKQMPSGTDWELSGTTGRIRVNDLRCELWTLEKDAGTLVPVCRHCRPRRYRFTGIESAARELIKCMETGNASSSDAREARKTVEILLGMLESQRCGNNRVSLPLKRS